MSQDAAAPVPSTIAAIASGHERAGVGVLRVSGPSALPLCLRLMARPRPLEPRRATLTRFVVGGVLVDQGLILSFPAPNSFTGEDVVELHTHGSPQVLRALLNALVTAGARLADPGEFTRRAVANGKLTLLEAEGLLELINAESEAQVVAAAAQLTGSFGARVDQLIRPLVDLKADLDGLLDFPDDADPDEGGVPARLTDLSNEAQRLQGDARRGALLRRGGRVVLYGPVNAGKSSLFNALTGSDRAIVDEEPGTTRDLLEAPFHLDGMSLTLVDTAGLREKPGRVESLGIQRSHSALISADLVLVVVPPDLSEDAAARLIAEAPADRRLVIHSKADVPRENLGPGLAVSVAKAQGIEALQRAVAAHFSAGAQGGVVLAVERHLAALDRAVSALHTALDACALRQWEIVSGELGLALDALAEVTGHDAPQAVLDAIYRRFCIGK